MGRLGMLPEEVIPFLRALQGSAIQVEGIFTHFARADEPESGYTQRQIEIFNQLLAELEQEGLKPPMVHAANSAAVFNFPQAWYNMVRPGNAIFGHVPFTSLMHLDPALKPALTWKARFDFQCVLFPPGARHQLWLHLYD